MPDTQETLEQENIGTQAPRIEAPSFDEQPLAAHPINQIQSLELDIQDRLNEEQIDQLGEEITGLQTTIQHVDQVLTLAESGQETIELNKLQSVDHYCARNIVGSVLDIFWSEADGNETVRKQKLQQRNITSFYQFLEYRNRPEVIKSERETKLINMLAGDSDFATAYRGRFMTVFQETKSFRLENNTDRPGTQQSQGLTRKEAGKKGLLIAAGVGLAVTLGNRLLGGESFKESIKKGGIWGGVSGVIGGGLASFFSLPTEQRTLEGLRNTRTGESTKEETEEETTDTAPDDETTEQNPETDGDNTEQEPTDDEVEDQEDTEVEEEETEENEGRTTQDTANTAIGAVGSAGLGYGVERYRQRTIERSLETDLEYTKTRNFLHQLSGDYARKGSPDNAKLTPSQRAAYSRAAERFGDLAQTSEAEFQSIAIYKRMLKEGIMSSSDLYQLDISPQSVGPLLDLLQSNSELAEQLAQLDDLDQIKQLLATHGIDDLPDGILTVIVKAKQVNDLLDTLTVFKYAKTIRQFGRFGTLLKVAIQTGRLDSLMIGVDWVFYNASMDQAEELERVNELRADILRSRAKRHLGTAIGGASMTIALGIVGALAACGPPGWVILVAGVAIGGLNAGIDAAIDATYFDVLDVYHYNKNDYDAIVAKHSVKVRDFIVGMAHGIYTGDVTIDDNGWVIALEILFPPYGIAKEIGFDTSLNRRVDDEVKNTSMQAAWKALIGFELVQQENEDGTKKYPVLLKYLSAGLTPEQIPEVEKEQYMQEQNKLAQEVQLVFNNYTTHYIPDHKNDQRADELLNRQGHSFINQKVGESITWYKASQDPDFQFEGSKDERLLKYKEHKKNKLIEQNETVFEERESSRDNSEQFRRRYVEFYHGARAYQAATAVELSAEQKQNRQFTKAYMEYKELFIPGEEILPDYHSGILGFHDRNFQLIDKQLTSLDIEGENVERSDSAMRYHLTQGQLQEKLNSKIRSTKDFFINYLLEVARAQGYEIYDETELLSYFNGEQHDMASHTGYEFKKKWFQSSAEWLINIDDPSEFENDLQTMEASSIYEKYLEGKKDTAHENADELLQQEFDQQNIMILERLLSYRDRKAELIYELNNLPSGEVPNWLVYKVNLHDAIKQDDQIGPVELFVFSRDREWKLVTTTSYQYRDRVLNIPGVTIRYIDKLREQLSDREQEYVDEVNYYKTQLDNLLQVHDFKLPEWYLDHHIKEHIEQRNQLQGSLLSSTPQEARFALEQKWEYYRDYFLNIYTAILLATSGNMMSRRVNTGQQITQIDQFVINGRYSIDQDGLEINEGVLERFGITGTSLKLKEEVSAQLQDYQIEQLENKTVQELIAEAYESQPANETLLEKAKWAANMILTGCLQANITRTNSNGKVYSIKSPNKKFYKTKEKLDVLFARSYFDAPMLDETTTSQNIDHNLVVSRSLRKYDQLFFEETQKLEGQIEQTDEDTTLLDRNLRFDNETGKILSHGHEVSLHMIGEILLGEQRPAGHDDANSMVESYVTLVGQQFADKLTGSEQERNQQVVRQTLFIGNIINFCKKYIRPLDLVFSNDGLYNKTNRIYFGTVGMRITNRLEGATKKVFRGVDGVEIVSKKMRQDNAPIILGNSQLQNRLIESFKEEEA